MKLCVDCKHYQYTPHVIGSVTIDSHKCFARVSPVTGLRVGRDCQKERASLTILKLPVGEIITGCGPEGNLWEPK